MIKIDSNSSLKYQSSLDTLQRENIGIDSGNGRLKALSSNGCAVRLPSLLYFPNKEFIQGDIDDNSSFIVYEGGTRGDLWGCKWIIGKEAYLVAPDTHLSTSEDKEAKVKYSLELLLGVAAHIIKSQKVKLTVTLSVHDKETFQDEIKSKIQGVHRIVANGKKSEVTVDLKYCVDEGVGAYYELLNNKLVQKKHTLLLLDIGEGTIITSVFYNGQKKYRKSYPLGTSRLYQRISNNTEMRKKLRGLPGNIELIKSGIERGDFIYGNNPSLSFSFKEIYRVELAPWVQESLLKVMTSVSEWMSEANHLFVIGGGVHLPGIKEWLEKKHFKTLNDSEMLNARGLLKLANRS